MIERYGRHDWTRTSDLYRVKVTQPGKLLTLNGTDDPFWAQ